MALIRDERKLNAVKYICRSDDSWDREESDRELYEEDPIKNADALVFKKGKEPIIFLLNFEFRSKEAELVKNAQTDGKSGMAVGSWAKTLTSVALKDIQYPASEKPLVEFKKDGSGLVQDRVLDVLESYGIVDEILLIYLHLKKTQEDLRANAKN